MDDQTLHPWLYRQHGLRVAWLGSRSVTPKRGDAVARSGKRLAWGVLISIWFAWLALAVTRLRRYEIAEASMAPALEQGDWVVAVRTRALPDHGHVVVFPHPLHRGFELVKRVVAVPGQVVAVRDGTVLVENQPGSTVTHGHAGPDREWVVPSGAVFVLGDALTASRDDSRHIGPVPGEDIGWRVVLRYWPPNRIGMVGARRRRGQ